MPEPPAEDGPILVQTQAIGICGTDLEIISGEHGSAPPGQDRLIITQADPGWLADLITREVPLDQWADAYARKPDDIKTVLNFPGALQ
jgi:hypothetical protein